MTLTFFDLPREIRDLIYEEALVGDGVISMRKDLGGLALSLLRTSKAIRHETCELFYSRNTFDVQLLDGTSGVDVGRGNAACVKHVVASVPVVRKVPNRLGNIDHCSIQLADLRRNCPDITSFAIEGERAEIYRLIYCCGKLERAYHEWQRIIDDGLKVFPALQDKVFSIEEKVVYGPVGRRQYCNLLSMFIQKLRGWGWSVESGGLRGFQQQRDRAAKARLWGI